MTNLQNEQLADFFQFFNNAAEKILLNNFDKKNFNNINLEVEFTSKIQNAESLQNNRALYKFEYLTGEQQGEGILMFPEKLLFLLSDISNSESENKTFGGTLGEVEIDYTKKLLGQIFKAIEEAFKIKYGRSLVFNENTSLILKEDAEYKAAFEHMKLNFQVNNKISVNEVNKFNFDLLLNYEIPANFINFLSTAGLKFDMKRAAIDPADLQRLSDVKINITAELGKAQIPIKYALELVRGSVVELDTLNNSDIKVFVNGAEFAKAQIFAVEDYYGLKITEIISPEDRMNSL